MKTIKTTSTQPRSPRSARMIGKVALAVTAIATTGALAACGSDGFSAKSDDEFYEQSVRFVNAQLSGDADVIKDMACKDSSLYEKADNGSLKAINDSLQLDMDDPDFMKFGVQAFDDGALVGIWKQDLPQAMAVLLDHPEPDSKDWCVADVGYEMPDDIYQLFQS